MNGSTVNGRSVASLAVIVCFVIAAGCGPSPPELSSGALPVKVLGNGRAIAVGAGAVWVTAVLPGSEGVLYRLDPRRLRVDAQIQMGKQPFGWVGYNALAGPKSALGVGVAPVSWTVKELSAKACT